jgi:hypothetical protein
MCPTKKISTLKVDNKILGMLDEVLGDFVKSHPVKDMTDVVKILQSTQLAYQILTTKEKVKSKWLENIENKIHELERKKSLLNKYKEDSASLKGENLKEARRIMGNQRLVLAKPEDLKKMISHQSGSQLFMLIKLRNERRGRCIGVRIPSLSFQR